MGGSVEVTGRGNDVEIENVQGTVNVNGSFGGNLEFKNLAKPLHFESRNTDLRVERIAPEHPCDDPASSERSDEDGFANRELLPHIVSPSCGAGDRDPCHPVTLRGGSRPRRRMRR